MGILFYMRVQWDGGALPRLAAPGSHRRSWPHRYCPLGEPLAHLNSGSQGGLWEGWGEKLGDEEALAPLSRTRKGELPVHSPHPLSQEPPWEALIPVPAW